MQEVALQFSDPAMWARVSLQKLPDINALQEHCFMVQELMHMDLWTALADVQLQTTLQWYNR